MNYIYLSVPTLLEGRGGGGESLLRNSAIFEVPSYFLRTDGDGTSRSLRLYNIDFFLFCINSLEEKWLRVFGENSRGIYNFPMGYVFASH